MRQIFRILFALVPVLFLTARSGAQIHLSQTFPGNTVDPSWEITDQGTGPCRWKIRGPHTGFLSEVLNLNGSNFLIANSDSGGSSTSGNETITSPVISYGNATQVLLRFSHYFRYSGPAAADSAIVEVFSGSSWISLEKITQTRGTGTQPALAQYDLSPYLNPQMKVRFRYRGTYAYYWLIDNIEVFTPPPFDAAASLVRIAAGPCGLPASFPVRLRVKNTGTSPITSLPARYRAAGGTVVEETFPVNITPEDTALLTFATLFQATPGTYRIQAWTALSQDPVASNDTALSAPVTRAPAVLNPVFFNGYTGTNLDAIHPGWRETTGNNPGNGTTSGWNQATNSQKTGLGASPARVNIFGVNRREWIITPAFNPEAGSVLRFKVAITANNNPDTASMGSDDSLVVRVSTNCGASWTRLAAVTRNDSVPNALTQFSVPLASLAGQTIRLGFFATAGTQNQGNDFDIHLNEIEILVPSPVDLRLLGVLAPALNCGTGTSFGFGIRVRNNGSLPVTEIPVFCQLSGQPVQSQTLTQGLAPGAEGTFQLPNPVPVPATGNYTFAVWVKAPGDANAANDSVQNLSVQPAPPSFTKNTFTSFTGSNLATVFPGWAETSGVPPAGTTSLWQNSAGSQTTGLGSVTARVNLFGSSRREWLVSPSFVPQAGLALRFKLAITNWNGPEIDSMGTDDSLLVLASTDCGLTWKRLRAFSRQNGLQNQLSSQLVSLENYEGQSVKIGFLATEGTTDDANDYDLHLDDIELLIPSPVDAQISAFNLAVSPFCGAPESLPVQVRVTNSGTQPLSNVPLRFSLNGGPETAATLAGPIAAGQTTTFSFPEPAGFPSPGIYRIKAWTAMPGDLNALNDTLLSDTLIRRGPDFPAVSFTGFTGGNLGSVFPGWREANGNPPVGVTSGWVSSTAAQTTFLGSATARINLFTNTRREWMISPGINPAGAARLRFRAAVTSFSGTGSTEMGTDDSLVVKVSADCGQTWSRVLALTSGSGLTNQLAEYSVLLTGLGNSTIQIGFFATDGTADNLQDYDFHLDDISVSPAPANDAGVSEFILPDLACGPPPSLTVGIRVANFGSQTQSSIPVFYSLNGGTPASGTLAGPLASGTSAAFSFPGTVDLSGTGPFVIRAWTALPGDGQVQNDTLASPVLLPPPGSFPETGFTGFDGSNLSQLFTGWEERKGAVPSGQISDWTICNAFQSNQFGSLTAKVNLAGNTRREWLISPALRAGSNANLRFKVAVTDRGFYTPDQMGADDSVNVMVTTSCGQTWTRVRAFTAANNLQNNLIPVSVDLSAYSGQVIRIGFKATEGNTDNTQDYDFHIDDVVADNTVAVREEEAADQTLFRVFPNPARDVVQVETGFPGGSPPELLGADGRRTAVTDWFREGSVWTARTGHLPAGVYFIRAGMPGGGYRTVMLGIQAAGGR